MARVVAPVVVVAVVVVLGVGAVAHIGKASGPDRRIVDRSFAVLAGPIVAQSNALGSSLRTLVAHGPTLERTAFFSGLDSLATGAAEDAHLFAALSPPDPSGEVAERCGSAMDGRGRAAGQIRGALEDLLGGREGLGGGDEAAAARVLAGAGVVLESADASWASCRSALRRAPGSARLVASTWVPDPAVWSDSALGSLVASLIGSDSLAPAHRLALLAVSTEPASVPGGSGLLVVPPTSALRLEVVVANQGNVNESAVQLELRAATPATTPAPAPVRVRAAIEAGHSVTLSPPPLSVRSATTYVIDVTATGAGGATASVSVTLRVAAVPPTTTTTTTPPTTTTTVTTTTTAKVTTTTVRSG